MRSAIHSLTMLICISLFASSSLADENSVGGDFKLTSHLNEPYTLTDSKGKVVILFFGFTNCPDICPSTLSTVQTLLDQLGNQAKYVQPLFISVDPERDTPEILHNYLEYFGNNFIGLTGTIQEINQVIKQFSGFYSHKGNTTEGVYTVDHTSNLYLVSTEGTVANIIPYGLPLQAITVAIKKLLPKETTQPNN